MPRTPDRFPGALEEDEEIRLISNATPPSQDGAFNYNGTSFQMKDATGIFDPRTGSGGITEAQHEALDTLVHDLSENYYLEVVRTSGRVTDIITWTDSGKTLKVREANITRTSGIVSQIVEKQYDGTGSLKYTMTYTVNRTGNQVSSIDAVKT